MVEITLEIHKPNRSDAAQLISELDAYLNSLYPPDSNYLLDIETLMQPSIRFILAFHQGEAVGCGAGHSKKGNELPDHRNASSRLYLASWLDTCSRYVIGWTMSDDGGEALVAYGLRMALAQQELPPATICSSPGTST